MKQLLILLSLLSISTLTYAGSAGWRSSNIQFLHGNQYELGPSTRESITVEHASSWHLGESYFFSNIFNRRDEGTELYAEFYPRITWNAVMDEPVSSKVFSDLSVVAGINIGNLPRHDPFKAYLLGVGVKFNVPAMDYLKLDFMAFKSDSVNTTGIQISPIWGMKFDLGPHRFMFKGFLDWQSSKATGGKATILAQPQLLLDIGHYWQHSNQFYAGVEYSYWYNKFGKDGVIERVPQAMILIPF